MTQRVLLYGMNYAPEIAGVGRYSGEIGEHLASLGHDVTAITTPPHYPGWAVQPGQAPNSWTHSLLAGVKVFRCPLYLHPKMSGWRRLLAPLSFALSSAPVALWQILTRRPNVVIVVEPTLFVAPIAILAARMVGARTVLHVQDLEIDAAFAVGHMGKGGPMARLAYGFERLVLRGFDTVITIANAMSRRIADKGVPADRIHVVRNWVDLDQIYPVPHASAYRAELGLQDDDFVVLYSGNLGAKQGVGLLIQAARCLEDHKDIVFVIAGQGPMRPDIEAAAKTQNNIRLKDFQPEARMRDFLGVADVHVLPQERGAADLLLPSKLGGMLASGRRIIATADPETELARFLGTSCVLTSPGDVSALAAAIIALKDAPYSSDQEAERLTRAAQLSKKTVIHDFAREAVYLQPNAETDPVTQPTIERQS